MRVGRLRCIFLKVEFPLEPQCEEQDLAENPSHIGSLVGMSHCCLTPLFSHCSTATGNTCDDYLMLPQSIYTHGRYRACL